MTAAFAALLIVSLAGCTVNLGHSTDTGSGSSSSKSAPVQSKDDQFLALMHDEYPSLPTDADPSLIVIGKNSCKALDEGATVEDVINTIASHASSTEVAGIGGYAVGAGVKVYCPEHMAEVQEYVADHS